LVVDLSARPDLRAAADALVAANLPVFLTWASPGNWRWHRVYELYPRFQLATVDANGALVAILHSVPVAWDDDCALPLGYDDVLIKTTSTPVGLARGAAICLLSISVRKDARRTGLAQKLITTMKDWGFAEGYRAVIAPLRPTRKATFPWIDMATYLAWKNEKGEVFDPWLRLHLAMGAQVLGVAERSLVIRQPRTRWERITGHDMSAPALYVVEGALVPVEIDVAGYGTYAEPNIWIGYFPARCNHPRISSQTGGLHAPQ
jgi:GNAT superfamily N-acetyltransferase